jgi:hypothetical protein
MVPDFNLPGVLCLGLIEQLMRDPPSQSMLVYGTKSLNRLLYVPPSHKACLLQPTD